MMVSSKCWEKVTGNQQLCGLKSNISKQTWNKNVLGQEGTNLHNVPTPNTLLKDVLQEGKKINWERSSEMPGGTVKEKSDKYIIYT